MVMFDKSYMYDLHIKGLPTLECYSVHYNRISYLTSDIEMIYKKYTRKNLHYEEDSVRYLWAIMRIKWTTISHNEQ
jgi:hypothetical protein